MTALTDLEARLSRLKHYLALDPQNQNLAAELADGMLGAGRPEEARPVVQQALELFPQAPAWRYRMAVVDHGCGRLAEARQDLDALVAEGIDEPAVLYELGQVAYALGDWSAAAAAVQSLPLDKLQPEQRTRMQLLRLRSMHRLGELDRAISLAEGYLAPMPQPAPVLRSAVATLYLDAERLPDAHRLYFLAQEQGDVDSEMLAVGGYLAMQAADPDEAVRRFEASLSATPDQGRALLGLGLAHAACGRMDQAKSALSQAVRNMQTHLGSWHALAWMHLLTRDLSAAKAAFEQALEADRTFGDTYGGLAILAVLEGDRAKAEEFIRIGSGLDRRSLNVGAAKALLQSGGTLGSPQFLEQGLQMLYTRALSRDAAQKSLFEQLLMTARGRAESSHPPPQ